jgi:hypothetical protein
MNTCGVGQAQGDGSLAGSLMTPPAGFFALNGGFASEQPHAPCMCTPEHAQTLGSPRTKASLRAYLVHATPEGRHLVSIYSHKAILLLKAFFCSYIQKALSVATFSPGLLVRYCSNQHSSSGNLVFDLYLMRCFPACTSSVCSLKIAGSIYLLLFMHTNSSYRLFVPVVVCCGPHMSCMHTGNVIACVSFPPRVLCARVLFV